MKLTAKDIIDCALHESQVGVWYLGQEGFLFKNGNKYLAIDPYLSDYVDRHCCEFVQWKRQYAPPIQAQELSFLNVVLCTHTHYDHADPDTLTKFAQFNPHVQFVVPAPAVKTVAGYGIEEGRILPAFAGRSLMVDGFEIFPVPSAHETLHKDENGHYCELGYVVKMNGKTVFHAGDMCMYDGLIETVKPFAVDMALLPINGRDYFRNLDDIIGNFTCEEAVLLAREIGAKRLVPMHHDLYAVNKVRTAHFVDAVEQLDAYRQYHIFAPGELYIL